MAAEMLTWSLLASVVLTVIVFCVIVWLWGAYLEEHEHDPGRVRAVMVIILAIVTAMEMGLAAYGLVRPRTAVISLLVNLWGGMDALLRFPASHDLESWFSVKQILLLSIKTMGYAWGFLSFRQNLGKFIGLLLLNIWGLPVLYLMALPLDPLEQVADDEYNVDLAYRVLQLVTNYKERRRCMDTCLHWWNRKLCAASEKSDFARIAICAASPQYRRAFNKKGRSV